MKDYLTVENERNRKHRELFTAMLREALGHPDEEVIIAHHLTFDNPKVEGEREPIEIPSADTLLFCHDFMKVLWPNTFLDVMCRLARVAVEQRDVLLQQLYDNRIPGVS